jgi:hypothetical protein
MRHAAYRNFADHVLPQLMVERPNRAVRTAPPSDLDGTARLAFEGRAHSPLCSAYHFNTRLTRYETHRSAHRAIRSVLSEHADGISVVAGGGKRERSGCFLELPRRPSVA